MRPMDLTVTRVTEPPREGTVKFACPEVIRLGVRISMAFHLSTAWSPLPKSQVEVTVRLPGDEKRIDLIGAEAPSLRIQR